MKKVICSSQSLSLKKYLKTTITSSLVLALLLPLSAIADEDIDSLTKPLRSESLDEKYNPLTNSSENLSVSVTADDDNNGKSTREDQIENQEGSSDISITDNSTSPTAAADAYINGEAGKPLSGKAPLQEDSKSIEVAEKSPSWMSLEYLLGGGGLLLLLLGGGFLLLSKFNNLKNENQELVDKNSSLKKQGSSQAMLVSNIKNENKNLESEVNRLKGMLDGYANTHDDKNTDASDLLSMPSLITPEPARFEELNESDRGQLASIFENWLKTNRGNTKVDDLIPDDINQKIKHLHYTIELWGQGSGLDSVESTKNTMHTAVISLIKNDNKGYAYCYIKPNSMSSLWDNKAWYAVEKSNGTLKLTGEPLEAN